MSTPRRQYQYEAGAFTDLSRAPTAVERPVHAASGTGAVRRLRRLAGTMGKQIASKTHELGERAAAVYDADYQAPDQEAPRAVITEYDTSNRRGVYRVKSSYWLRGYIDMRGQPLYQRVYVFPLPVLDEQLGKHELLSNYPDMLEHNHPVRKLGRYCASRLKDQAWEMNLYGSMLETKLTPQGDAMWQREAPEAFHKQLSNLLHVLHPNFPYSPVEQAEGVPPGFTGRISG